MGSGSEQEIAPSSREIDIGPSVEFMPDAALERQVLMEFAAKDRSHRYDGSVALPLGVDGAPRL